MKRFLIPALLLIVNGATLLAAQPSWWSEEGTRIVEEAADENNYAPANLGQLKHVAHKAKIHLDSNLLDGSGTAINSLVATFVSSTNPEDIAANYAPLNVGQLKAVAKPFYDRLIAAGYDTNANLIARGYSDPWSHDYPWNPSTPVEQNYVPANIGQLKLVFSFDVENTDSEPDGLPDWWELGRYGDLSSDGTGDWDEDGISDATEFTAGSDAGDYYQQGSTTITPHLSILGGDGQFGLPNQYLPNPLSVEVRSGSSTGALLNRAPVTYALTSGSGGLATAFGETATGGTLTVKTGTNGQASAFYKQAGDLNSTIAARGSSVTVNFTAHATQADGLVGRWAFNEGTGTLAAETTVLSASGTLISGVSWEDGFDGAGAIGFSGTDYVTMGSPANGSLDLGTGSFSVTAWVKYSDATMASGENYQRIVSKGHKDWNGGYVLAIDGEGQIVGGVGTMQTGTASEALLFSSTNAFNDDQWHHVALVVNASSKLTRIYVDGVAQGLEKKSGTGGALVTNAVSFSSLSHLSPNNTGAAFTVGGYNGTEEFFKGQVDELGIYRRALTNAEIRDLREVDADENGLPDWWEGKYFGGTDADLEGNPDDDDLLNWQEYQAGTNPTDSDSDNDDMPDGWEVLRGLNPLDDEDAALDKDGDGLTNLHEYEQESDPNDYYSQGSTTVVPHIALLSGDGQVGNTGQFLTDALSVEVRSGSSAGALLNNAPVAFSVEHGFGELAAVFGGTNTSSIQEVKTGTNGTAQVWYRQGNEDRVESVISAQTGMAVPVEFTSTTVDLVSRWNLDEGTGAVAADAGPFAFSGTLQSGPAWIERYEGENALSFNGTTDYVLVLSGTSPHLDFEDQSFSVAAWVKTGTDQAGRIVSKGAEAANAGYFLGINAQGQIDTSLGTTATGTSAETIHVKTTGTYGDDTWHQVVAVYDRENAAARIYVDGSARVIAKEAGTGGTINVTGSTTLDYPTLENLSGNRSAVPLTIASDSGTGAFFEGSLDNVMVYRKALSAAEVASLYQDNGPLMAFSQTVTINEDTLGVIGLQHQGGGNASAVYSIVDEPADGDVELEGNVLKYYANAHFSGTNVLTFGVEKDGREAEGEVTIIVLPINDPPLVSVGGGQSIAMSGSTASLILSVTVTDIDTDPEDIQLTWMKVSGTETVTFTGTNPLAATATFSAPGEYLLRLSANDGASTRSDSLIVTVNSSSTSLPTISLEDPDNNTAYEFDEVIAIKAAATAASGLTVSRVEFFDGSRKIGEDTTPHISSGLYEFNWKPQRLGAYAISAKVTDSGGKQAFSTSILARMIESGWFAETGMGAGNEGYAGSGGTGGVSAGSSTSTSSDHGPGTGSNGGGGGGNSDGDDDDWDGESGGGTAGGGGNGMGDSNDVIFTDSDGDGISDAEEDEIGLNKMATDTDGDGVPDTQDGWAGGSELNAERELAPERLPVTKYILVDLGDGEAWDVNNRNEILFNDGETKIYQSGTTTSLPGAAQINEAGQVFGWDGVGPYQWQNGTRTALSINAPFYTPVVDYSSGQVSYDLVGEFSIQLEDGTVIATNGKLATYSEGSQEDWENPYIWAAYEDFQIVDFSAGTIIMRAYGEWHDHNYTGQLQMDEYYDQSGLMIIPNPPYPDTEAFFYPLTRSFSDSLYIITPMYHNPPVGGRIWDNYVIAMYDGIYHEIPRSDVYDGPMGIPVANLNGDFVRFYWTSNHDEMTVFTFSQRTGKYIFNEIRVGQNDESFWGLLDNFSRPAAMNNQLQITASNSLWQNYKKYDLSKLCDSLSADGAYEGFVARDINDGGVVVGSASKIKDDEGNDITPTQRAVALLPVTLRFWEVTEEGSLELAKAPALTMGAPSVKAKSVAIENLRPAGDGKDILADIKISVDVTSDALDCVEGEAGTIESINWQINPGAVQIGAPIDATYRPWDGGRVRLSVRKAEDANSDLHRYPYEGKATTTLRGVKVLEGANVLRLEALDDTHQQSNHVDIGFVIEAEPDAGATTWTETLSVTTTTPPTATTIDTVQVQFANSRLTPLSVSMTETGTNSNLYKSADETVALEFVSAGSNAYNAAISWDGVEISSPHWALVSTGSSGNLYAEEVTLIDWEAMGNYGNYSLSLVTEDLEAKLDDYHSMPLYAIGEDENTPGENVGVGAKILFRGKNGPIHRYFIEVLAPEGLFDGYGNANAAFTQIQDEVGAIYDVRPVEPTYPLNATGDLNNGDRRFLYERDGRKMAIFVVIAGPVPRPIPDDEELAEATDDLKNKTWSEAYARGFLDGGAVVFQSRTASATHLFNNVSDYAGSLIEDPQLQLRNSAQSLYSHTASTLEAGKNTAREIVRIIQKVGRDGETAVEAMIIGDDAALEGVSEEYRDFAFMTAELIEEAYGEFKTLPPHQKAYLFGRMTPEIIAFFAENAATGGAVTVISKANFLKNLRNLKFFQSSNPRIAGLLKKMENLANVFAETGRMCFVEGTPIHSEYGTTPIEEVTVGSKVWSRDPLNGKQELKKVTATFVTHPDMLFHIRYSTQDRHNGNEEEEQIVCTAEHPFFEIGKSSFIPASEVKPGSRFKLLTGSEAVVLEIRTEAAPAGERFKTYNFEVEDFHTYFAGAYGIWVHNKSKQPCDTITSMFVRKAKKLGPGVNLKEHRFNVLRDTRIDLLIDKSISDANWRQSGVEVSKKMMDDFATGEIVNLSDLPSVTRWNGEYFGAQGASGSILKGQGLQDAVEVHHSVEKWIQKRLGLGETDDVPGAVLFKNVGAPDGHAALQGRLRNKIWHLRQPDEIVSAMREVYNSRPEWRSMWPVAEKWLQSQGISIPN